MPNSKHPFTPMKMRTKIFISFLILLSLPSQINVELDAPQSRNLGVLEEIQVGVILDLGSLVGNVVHSCITMAISDFYAVNRHFKTRIVLQTRDSKGESLCALSAALDLLENIKVQAIIGPGTSPEAKFLAALGDKAKVPILSFSTSPSFTEYPYFVQVTQDETIQFEGIATIIGSFKWRDVILIYEDIDYGREVVPYLVNSFQEKNIRIAYRSAISPSATDDQILEEVHNLMTMQTTTFVVHASLSLASRLFLKVKSLGMMSGGYSWIITDKTINLLHSMDTSVIESMQGALGFKSFILPSSKLHNFTLRWKRKFRTEEPNMEMTELNVFGIWAYDAIWALARAVEHVVDKISQTKEENAALNMMELANIRASESGSILLNEILQIRLEGLSGTFQFMSGKLISNTFEVVNILGKGERRIGFWTLSDGITKEMYSSLSEKFPSSNSGLESVIWPGGSTITPKGWLMRMSGKKLKIGVPVKPGFTELVKVDHDPQTNATTVTGFCIDVFSAAIDALQYDISYEFIPFADFNIGWMWVADYNNLIDQVYLQNYDAVVGDTTITANRSLYVDFTLPYTDLGVGTIARINNKNMWIFLKPLDSDLWLTSASLFILMGFVVWVIEHPINEEFQGSRAQQIGKVFSFSLSTLFYAHREKLLSTLSRIVVVVWLFVVFILTSTYTATWTSLLTVEQIPLSSKENYIGYQFGSDLIEGVVVSNLNLTDARLKPYSSTEEYADALSKGNKNGGVAAIIDEIPYIKIFLARYSDNYALIASESTSNGFGFVFRKGSPLVPEMSKAILKLREEGKLMVMEKAWFTRRTSFMSRDSVTSPSNNPKVLNLDNLRGVFLISGICSALALVIFSINLLREKWHVIKYYFVHLVQGNLGHTIMYLFRRSSNMNEETNSR